MRKSENGSVTLIVLVTILFILIMLSANLIYVSSKRKSQLQESMILQNIYQGEDINKTYEERLKKENIVSETEQTPETVRMDQIEQFDQANETNQANQTKQTNETNKSNTTNETNQANETSQINQIN